MCAASLGWRACMRGAADRNSGIGTILIMMEVVTESVYSNYFVTIYSVMDQLQSKHRYTIGT